MSSKMFFFRVLWPSGGEQFELLPQAALYLLCPLNDTEGEVEERESCDKLVGSLIPELCG